MAHLIPDYIARVKVEIESEDDFYKFDEEMAKPSQGPIVEADKDESSSEYEPESDDESECDDNRLPSSSAKRAAKNESGPKRKSKDKSAISPAREQLVAAEDMPRKKMKNSKDHCEFDVAKADDPLASRMTKTEIQCYKIARRLASGVCHIQDDFNLIRETLSNVGDVNIDEWAKSFTAQLASMAEDVRVFVPGRSTTRFIPILTRQMRTPSSLHHPRESVAQNPDPVYNQNANKVVHNYDFGRSLVRAGNIGNGVLGGDNVGMSRTGTMHQVHGPVDRMLVRQGGPGMQGGYDMAEGYGMRQGHGMAGGNGMAGGYGMQGGHDMDAPGFSFRDRFNHNHMFSQHEDQRPDHGFWH